MSAKQTTTKKQTKPAAASEPGESLPRIMMQIFEQALPNLAIDSEDGPAGKIARRLLRAKRDKEQIGGTDLEAAGKLLMGIVIESVERTKSTPENISPSGLVNCPFTQADIAALDRFAAEHPKLFGASDSPAPEPLPDWVTETPEEMAYDLEVFDSGGDCVQHIDLDRDEFIDLKAHLAKMRGYAAQPDKLIESTRTS